MGKAQDDVRDTLLWPVACPVLTEILGTLLNAGHMGKSHLCTDVIEALI